IPAPTPDRTRALSERPDAIVVPRRSTRPPRMAPEPRYSMSDVFARLEQRLAEYRTRPFLRFLRDPAIDPQRKLAFAPHVAHFVLSFGDLCSFVLPEHPAPDWYQDLVNENCAADTNHWRWFLSDLRELGQDPKLDYSDAIRLIWSERTVRTRKLSYHLGHLGLAADTLGRLVLVHCIEGAFQVTVTDVAAASGQYAAATGKRLRYLGQNHSEAESTHALENPETRRRIAAIQVEPDAYQKLCEIVDRCFELFGDFTDEMLSLATAPPVALSAHPAPAVG
ncbi:MAG TPA: hypothetical protein VGK73_03335, partial [Polyangiaceae bacterium]